MTEPKDLDYTKMPIGHRVRLPKGVVAVCPKCRRHGLRLVFSFRRGSYKIAYWHTAVKDHVGFAPLLVEGCMIEAATLTALPRSEREPP